MKNNQIRDNINKLLSKKKKLLAYTTAFTLATASLTGCGKKESPTKETVTQEAQDQRDHFTYNYEEDGTITMKGSISYDKFSELEIIRINNFKENTEAFYIFKRTDSGYFDIEHNQYIFRYYSSPPFDDYTENYGIYSVNDFLLEKEKVKDCYSVDEFQEIKAEMIDDIKNSKDMFTYVYEKDGTVTMKGGISYENLSNLHMISVYDKRFYICQCNWNWENCIDIEQNQQIIDDFRETNDGIKSYSVGEFLLEQENTKKYYSVDDFKKLKKEMIKYIKPNSTTKKK